MLNYKLIVLFCVSVSAQLSEYYYRVGVPCSVAREGERISEVGVCKELHLCQMAMRLISVDKLSPALCFRDNKVAVACCPTKDSLFKTGALRQIYKWRTDNFIRSNNITCYYDGNEPMVCCGNTKPIEYREPSACPRLPKPEISTGNRIYNHLVAKFSRYQKHYNKCVNEKNGNGYVRNDTCGMPITEVRTTGGEPAQPREFPHMAVLGTSNSDPTIDRDIDWIAGGALVSDKYILTAGHALKNSNGDLIRYALLGALNKTEVRSGMLFTIVRLIPHNDYDPRAQTNDIALVELERRVPFSEFIRPLCLPLPGMNLTLQQYTIAGWGLTEDHVKAETLLKVVVSQKRASLCSHYNTRNRIFNSTTMICAKGVKLKDRNVFKDSCQGDSGGPLVIRSREIPCSYIAVGVVSHGADCGVDAPAVYTKVEPFLDWIIETVWPELLM